MGKSEPVSASDELDTDDLYVKYKKLQQQLEFLQVQEEYIKVIKLSLVEIVCRSHDQHFPPPFFIESYFSPNKKVCGGRDF